MKKRKLYSLAVLAASMIVPCTLSFTASIGAAPYAESRNMSADEFIEQFCGSRRMDIGEQKTQSGQFVWFETVNDENRQLICSGRALFDTLDRQVQQTIVQACKAHQIDYLSFTDSALSQSLARQSAPADSAGAEEVLSADGRFDGSSQASNSQTDTAESENSREESQTDQTGSFSSQIQADSQSSQETEKPSGSQDKKEETDPAADPFESEQITEDNKDDASLLQKEPAETTATQPDPADSAVQDSSGQPYEETDQSVSDPDQPHQTDQTDAPVSFPKDPAANRPQLSAPPFAVPFNPSTLPAGLSCAPAAEQPSEALLQAAGLIAQNAGLQDWILLPVIYTYSGADIQVSSSVCWFVQSPSQTVIFRIISQDAGALRIQFLSDSSCTYDAASGLLLSGGSEVTFTSQPLSPQQTIDETAPLAPLRTPAAPSLSMPPVQEVNTPVAVDQAASAFISRYCYLQGGLIRQTDAASAQQILNSLSSWLSLPASSRQAVNTYLQSMGGTTWQNLYRQANQTRLGLPRTSLPVPAAKPAGRTPSTGAAAALAAWTASAVFSLEAMFYLAMMPKRKD